MMHRRTLLLFVTVARCIPAAQEFNGSAERPQSIAEQLERSRLSPDQKDRVAKLVELRDYKAAETILVQAIEANPQDAGLLTLAARIFLLDKNPLNAAIAFKKAAKLGPLSPADRFSLAIAYIGIRKGSWARPELERLAEADPKDPLYQYWLARVDYDQHLYDSAVQRLRGVTKSHPDFTRAWDNLGLSLEGTGQLSEAAISYRHALRLNREQTPHSPWPPLNLGTLLTRTGELHEAEELLREAVQYDQNVAEAHHRLGVNLHKQNRKQDAIVELRRAIELDPSATEPLYALGQIYREQGNTAAAAEAFQRFKALKRAKRGM